MDALVLQFALARSGPHSKKVTVPVGPVSSEPDTVAVSLIVPAEELLLAVVTMFEVAGTVDPVVPFVS